MKEFPAPMAENDPAFKHTKELSAPVEKVNPTFAETQVEREADLNDVILSATELNKELLAITERVIANSLDKHKTEMENLQPNENSKTQLENQKLQLEVRELRISTNPLSRAYKFLSSLGIVLAAIWTIFSYLQERYDERNEQKTREWSKILENLGSENPPTRRMAALVVPGFVNWESRKVFPWAEKKRIFQDLGVRALLSIVQEFESNADTPPEQVAPPNNLTWKTVIDALAKCNTQAANLNGANLKNANLFGVNLKGANLIRAILNRTILYGADLRQANLSGADLVETNLIDARLGGANLSGATLIDANLMWAKLEGANLRGANLNGANLRGANLFGADLRGAKFEGAKGIDLNLAIIDQVPSGPEQ